MAFCAWLLCLGLCLFCLGFVIICSLVWYCVFGVCCFCFALFQVFWDCFPLFSRVECCCLCRFVFWCFILGLWVWSGFVLEVCGVNIFKIYVVKIILYGVSGMYLALIYVMVRPVCVLDMFVFWCSDFGFYL